MPLSICTSARAYDWLYRLFAICILVGILIGWSIDRFICRSHRSVVVSLRRFRLTVGPSVARCSVVSSVSLLNQTVICLSVYRSSVGRVGRYFGWSAGLSVRQWVRLSPVDRSAGRSIRSVPFSRRSVHHWSVTCRSVFRSVKDGRMYSTTRTILPFWLMVSRIWQESDDHDRFLQRSC